MLTLGISGLTLAMIRESVRAKRLSAEASLPSSRKLMVPSACWSSGASPGAISSAEKFGSKARGVAIAAEGSESAVDAETVVAASVVCGVDAVMEAASTVGDD